jgi:hypothetical protein
MIALKNYQILLIIITSLSCSPKQYPKHNIQYDQGTSGSISHVTNEDGRIFFWLNMQDDSVKMMVDSYASFSGIPTSWQKKYNLPKYGLKHKTTDYQNNKRRSPLYVLDKAIVYQAYTLENMKLKTSAVLDEFDVGILGAADFSHLNWKFDFENGISHFSDKPFESDSGMIKRELKQGYFPRFELAFDDILHEAVLDLGGSKALALPADSEIGRAIIAKYNPEKQIVLSGGANKNHITDEQYIVQVDEIRIQGITFRDIRVVLSKNSKVSFLGSGFWSKGELIINYQGKGEERFIAFKPIQ